MTNEFIKEFGTTLYQDLCAACRVARSSHSVYLPYSSGDFTFTRMKEKSAVVTYQKNNLKIDIELFFHLSNTDVTYYHSNKPKITKNPLFSNNTQNVQNQAKQCTCDWSLIQRSGCHCGAIVRYKPKY